MTLQKPVCYEMTLDAIRSIASDLAKLVDTQEIYYFGSRRWDLELSFGMVEFVLVVSNPSFYTQSVQEDLIDRLPLTFEVVLTFIEDEVDVMTGAILMWPPKI